MTNPTHIHLAAIEPDSTAGHARLSGPKDFGFSVSPPVVSPPNTVAAGAVAPPHTGVPG
ncbi:hypothetical protein ACMX25_28885 [Caballeronia sp. 15715]